MNINNLDRVLPVPCMTVLRVSLFLLDVSHLKYHSNSKLFHFLAFGQLVQSFFKKISVEITGPFFLHVLYS